MITISLCMIVKNEEDTLSRCLNSVKDIVDEIIIVDTGSTDGTKEIASYYTDNVYDFEWENDFSAARNFSYEKATKDYILWLDADDVILPEDAVKLKKLKQSITPSADAVMMKYNIGFDSRGNVTFSYYRERLTKRERRFKWREPVHEYIEVRGRRITADISVTHAKPKSRQSTRNIEIYENLLAKGGQLSPRGLFYFARELKDNRRYAEAITYFQRFLDSAEGWVEDNISACGELAKCCLEEGMEAEALHCMLRSFCYDTPRAEICCQIGYYFKERGKYKEAAFWFELILSLKRQESFLGFISEDCWGYIPCIELAVCYDKLGDHTKAEAFNDRAAVYKPTAPPVLYNKKYFARLNNST